MHNNSIESYKFLLAKGITGQRAHWIYSAFRKYGPMTDRQVLVKLWPMSGDPNKVRPRISEMIGKVLFEVGETKDPYTGRAVRIVSATRPEAQ